MHPDVLGGKACVRGLRISAGMTGQMVAGGKSTGQIIDEYPYLEAEDVRQALAYSALLAEERVPPCAASAGVKFLVDENL